MTLDTERKRQFLEAYPATWQKTAILGPRSPGQSRKIPLAATLEPRVN